MGCTGMYGIGGGGCDESRFCAGGSWARVANVGWEKVGEGIGGGRGRIVMDVCRAGGGDGGEEGEGEALELHRDWLVRSWRKMC